MSYIIALDQGTTSSRAILFNQDAEIKGIEQQEFTQHFPRPGWVEHDPMEIVESQKRVLEQLIKNSSVSVAKIRAIGLTNQRETTIVWDRNTGQPVYPAIVWQDKRTTNYCETLKNKGWEDAIREKTGLVIDPYFSGTKLKWILDNVEGARDQALNGDLLFGTIDSWLLWNFTDGAVHATDYTNASRTLLFNIHELKWDQELLNEFQIPEQMLPTVHPSSHHFGEMTIGTTSIPVTGVAGDQQAALFGQACFEKGQAKNTYGTGCFLLMNMGDTPVTSSHGLLTTMACSTDDNPQYAFEGSVFIAGAVIQWLRDGLKIIDHANETEQLIQEIEDEAVIVVPSFAGLGAPYWDATSKGAIFGLTRDTSREHLVKGALESIAFQTRDVLEAMQNDTGTPMENLMVDGGACANNYLMQFQADILGIEVDRPAVLESTALGAAFLAGLAVGVWTLDDLREKRKSEKLFQSTIDATKRDHLYERWKNAVSRTLNWGN